MGKWAGCCPGCNEWNSIIEKTTVINKAKVCNRLVCKLGTLDTVKDFIHDRITSDITEWDRVLGGGIMPGSFLILTGDPGIGKSTLLLQIASNISLNHKVIFFSSEESLQQIKNRATRLKCKNKILFSEESSLEKIIATGQQEKPDLLILDSIQNCYIEKAQAIPGTIAQLRESGFHLMRLAKENNISILVTGHITKDGHMAGPKLLEHIVDGVFYLQGEESWKTRILRSIKNRFGTINEMGFFTMEEKGLIPVEDINKELIHGEAQPPGSALIITMEGTRPLILEVQALCVQSKYGMPQRVISGIDPKRVIIIAAILEKYLKIRLSSHDIFFKVSGGFKIKESSSDLGIALALLSSYFQKPLPEKSISIAEISLTGQIKQTRQLSYCIKEAKKYGIQSIFTAKAGTAKTDMNTIKFLNVFELLTLFPQ